MSVIVVAIRADELSRVELRSGAERADALHLCDQFRFVGLDKRRQRLARRLVDRLAGDLRLLLQALGDAGLDIANQNIDHAASSSARVLSRRYHRMDLASSL